jgi:glycerol-3-phosphate dehydrogenase subunit B
LPPLKSDDQPVLITENQVARQPISSYSGSKCDVIVIGAGLAGLIASLETARSGKTVRALAKGFGTTHWGSGCIDVLGYLPSQPSAPVPAPAEAIQKLASFNPAHPYSLLGLEKIQQAIEDFQAISAEVGLQYYGSLDKNILLPTAIGSLRPTCFIPGSMIAGDTSQRQPMLIVGFEGYHDFYARLISDNLIAQGVLAKAYTLHLKSLEKLQHLNSLILARLFDDPEFRSEVAQTIQSHLGRSERVGFPAVLGYNNPLEAQKDLETRLGVPVFEIPGLPPSIPGIRLHRMLIKAIRGFKGQLYEGMQIQDSEIRDKYVEGIWSESAARRKIYRAEKYILATGGYLGGGTITKENHHAFETIFNLPLISPGLRNSWFSQDFLDPDGQPIFKTGIRVNQKLFPTDDQQKECLKNVRIAGAALGGGDFLRERSMEGVALVTGYWAARFIGEES